MDEKRLSELIERLVAQGPIDWATLEREATPREEAESLRKLQRVAHAFSSLHKPTATATDSSPAASGAPSPASGKTPVQALAVDDMPKRFGRLEVCDVLGRGWDGTVFRAFDPSLERVVALKLRRSASVNAVGGASRLLREARLLARIRHPHVLAVHGADEIDGWVGIWSDLLDGETLEQRLSDSGRFGVEEARSVGLALCQALAAIHAAGITHGDIKTANVMRERDGRIVLLDFGSARPAWLTELATGSISGSPLYMAPEILEGAETTPRSDIYALGVTLYRLLSGAYPVEAVSMVELRARHARGERVLLRDRRPDLPIGLVTAIERALAVDPLQRVPSAGVLEQELSLPRPRARRRVLGLAVATALVLAGALLWQSRSPAPALGADVELHRAGELAALYSGARLRPGDGLYLSVDAAAPVWLYVLNEDSAGVVTALFPLTGILPNNPLDRDRGVRVPALVGTREINWEVGAGRGDEVLLVIASSAPMPWLEQRVADWQRPSADAPLVRSIDRLGERQVVAAPGRLDALAQEIAASSERERIAVRRFVLANPAL